MRVLGVTQVNIDGVKHGVGFSGQGLSKGYLARNPACLPAISFQALDDFAAFH